MKNDFDDLFEAHDKMATNMFKKNWKFLLGAAVINLLFIGGSITGVLFLVKYLFF